MGGDQGKEGRHGEVVQRGSRPPHGRPVRDISHKASTGDAPAHVEKRRHAGRIKSAQPPRSLSSPYKSPTRSPSRPLQERRRGGGGARGRGGDDPGWWLCRPGRAGSGRPEMTGEGPADLRELVRLPDVLVVCSSTGWTDEKHMLYLQLLEETFVSQLHDGECSFKGLFNRSPRHCRRMKSSKQSVKYTKPDQGCREIVDGDRIKSSIKFEHIDSPCVGNQQDGKINSMDDNASTTEPVEEATSHARATSSGKSSTCYFGKHKHSPSRSAEGSDQNFDEETRGIGESTRGCSQKRLKSADDRRDDQAVPSAKAEVQQAGCPIASDKDGDNCDSSSKMHAGLLDAEPGSPSCKGHGPKG